MLCINYLLFSRKVMSDSLRLHGLQHTRPLCPALSPGVCSSSCPLSQWWYLTISFSASLFSFCLQSSPASRSFPILYIYMCVCVCVCISYISKKNWQNYLDAFTFPDPLLLFQQLSFISHPWYNSLIPFPDVLSAALPWLRRTQHEQVSKCPGTQLLLVGGGRWS